MPSGIRQVAVLGSGLLGRQLAFRIARADVHVVWLDSAPGGEAARQSLATAALESVRKDERAAFAYDKAGMVTYGALKDDLGRLFDADWILDALPENFGSRTALYRQIDGIRKRGSIVSAHAATSGIDALIEGQSDAFARDFMIAHFFGFTKGVRLLEMAAGPATRRDAVEWIGDFCDRRLGESVIACKGAPGLAALRLGLFFIHAVLNAARDFSLTIDETDEILARTMPLANGVSGFIDRVDADRIIGLTRDLLVSLPPDDPFHRVVRRPDEKSGVDLRGAVQEAFGRERFADPGVAGKAGPLTWRVLSETLVYACRLVPDILDDAWALDEVMRLGFGWQQGPFGWADKLGVKWVVEKLAAEGWPVPELLLRTADRSFYRIDKGRVAYLKPDDTYAPVIRPPGVLSLADIKRKSEPLLANRSAQLWDLGDGALCLALVSPDGVIDDAVLSALNRAGQIIGDGRGLWKGLILYNENAVFSKGVDRNALLPLVLNANREALEEFARKGQWACQSLRFAPFPSVAAVAGQVMGGGCELALHCSAIQAHDDSVFSLTDPDLGLTPCWGGCAQLLGRAFGAQQFLGKPPVSHVFSLLHSGEKVPVDAAKNRQYLRYSDGVTANRDRLLYDAKQRLLDLAKDYRPPQPWPVALPGRAGRAALELLMENVRQKNDASPHEPIVWKALANVLCGGRADTFTGPVTEDKIRELEESEFLWLAQFPEVRDCLERPSVYAA